MTTPTPPSPASSATANYADSGAFGAELGTGTRQALLMIDFAQAYFDPASPLYAAAPQVLDTAGELLRWARSRGMLICHTQVVYDEAGLNGGVFYRKIPALSNFRRGHPLGAFVPPVQPQAGEAVVEKQYASAFFGTSLLSLLNAQRIDCVLIAGMSTSGCVRATTVDAVQLGFIPLVVADACGDRHPAPHEANLFDMQAKYADVMPFEALRQKLERG
ncbi:MAG: isochorismatase family protein [Ottowia sp.]|uniref:isochorismatase family protein n=1 Tax=unclassified Ottowia TaxID=2645081 RepID=UPI003C2AEDB8